MKVNKINQIANYLEELSWLIDSNNNPSFKEISLVLRELNNERNHIIHGKSFNEDGKHNLVGILPKLLQDNKLFKSNSEMLDFAEEVLDLKPSRASKRSRIEYIGWIVCEVANSNNKKLNDLHTYLSDILGNEKTIKKIRDAKKSPNFSWNSAIRKIKY